MSKQKFNAAQREAIWSAHQKKCAYTGRLLDVSNFHIDHIIPESIAKDTAALNSIITEYDLPVDFDIGGYENLLPCYPSVNLQKHSSLLSSTRYYLSIASSKKAIIEANLDQILKRESRGKASILLMRCLDRGDLTPHQISEILQRYPEQSEPIFELIESMQFADATEVKFIAKADIESLWDLPIRFGENDHIDSLTLTNKKHEKVNVRTCREYESALEQGYFAYTNFDIKMSTWFVHQCGLLKYLQIARTPQQSFVSNPKVGIVDLELIPLSFFPWIEDEMEGEELCATYQDKVKDRELVVKSVSQNSLRIEGYGLGQSLVEVVKSDFNRDGIEDILIFEYYYATHGTLGASGVHILTRKSADSKFEIIRTLFPLRASC